MKYCIFCGLEIGENDKICHNCGENISEVETNRIIQANIECIKCHSHNVTYSITKKKKHNIIFEHESFLCNECGKRFTNKERLGHSFSNKFQILLTNGEKILIKWLLIICVIFFIIVQNGIKTSSEQNSWTRIDYSEFQSITFKEIKEVANKDLDEARRIYVGNSYIFTTTIREVNGREIITPIEDNDYSGSYIYINNEDMEKLKKYKEGDIITIAGTISKISLYHKVYVKNATIIE